jgi:chromosomal replication initiator protein
MTHPSFWNQALILIKEAIGVSAYETWFSALVATEKGADTLIIETPDEFFKNWIIDHYQDIILEKLGQISPKKINISFSVIKPSLSSKTPTNSHFPSISEQNNKHSINQLNPRFSFENFVVGSSNRFAYSACLAVAESPAKAYNPLFIYGPVGLGKTHLMQSITHQIFKKYPRSNCCYLSSERFTNELIDAIQNRATSQFRKKYRDIDVLLIDDIHFLAGKEYTQEEFFHTFNTLHNNRKQIILSSDRPPKEIAKLEERLRSRFAWGLITDIQPPDFETRVAILKKKIEHESVAVPNDVILFIAEQITANIRELEGALIRVLAYSLLEEKIITLDMTKAVLKDLVKETIKKVSIEEIQQKVAAFFNMSCVDLKAKKRNKNIILPRQIAMYLCRQMTTHSLPEIGVLFGGKDHTTVLHSFKKIEQAATKNQELKNTIEKLTIQIKQ